MLTDLPVWLFSAGFVLLALFYTNTVRERVPLYLTNRTTWAALAQMMDDVEPSSDSRPKFVDLGCGVGGLVAYLARQHRDWDVVGVETAPGPYLIAKIRCAFITNATVRYQNLWHVNLSEYSMAYAFLSPAPMARLLDKAKAEMAPGSWFVSNSFWSSSHGYDKEVQVNDKRQSRLFVRLA